MRDIYEERPLLRNGFLLEGTDKDLLDYLLPNTFKHGSCRRVFEFRNELIRSALPLTPDPNGGKGTKDNIGIVVKVACLYENSILDGVEANLTEWNVWCRALGHPEIQRWLCPVLDISMDGRFLTMARCEPIANKDIPDKIPAFLADVHSLNWGWYTDPDTKERRPVMLDYGHVKPVYIEQRYNTYDEANYIDREAKMRTE